MDPNFQTPMQVRDVGIAWSPVTPLLRDLPPVVWMKLRLFLEAFSFSAGHCFQKSGEEFDQLHFLESGLVSQTAGAGKDAIEIALLGNGDIVGLAAIFGEETASTATVAHVNGTGWRLSLENFRAFAVAAPQLQLAIDRYLLTTLRARSTAIIAAARCTVRERLAAWLYRAFELQGTASIRITHENLATTLGVRRPGITVAVHELEGEHAIRAFRSDIQLQDRERLRSQAGKALR